VLLGTVDHLIETGANDVLVVKATPDSVDDQERLIPYLVDDVVTRVDLEAGVIEVDWFLDE
jgi:16S rRNA processing protein RimM